jgi:hypothetical protein
MIFLPICRITHQLYSSLVYWIFVPLIQKALDKFRDWWNGHRIRYQKEKLMPSGHVPEDVLENPGRWAAKDCRIRVERDAIDVLRGYVTEDAGPREEHYRWYSNRFEQSAEDAYMAIRKPKITVDNAWDLFKRLIGIIRENGPLEC